MPSRLPSHLRWEAEHRDAKQLRGRAPNIILIGFMGSGKTTVGRALARRLRWRFLDLDRVIASTAGRSVPEVFRRFGERRFRRLEHRAIRNLRPLRRAVVAAGGGAPTYAPNRPWLRRAGVLVHLMAPAPVLARRLRGGAGRPLLAAAGGDARRLRRVIGDLLRARRAAYAMADLAVRAGRGGPAAVAARVERATRPWRRAHGV